MTDQATTTNEWTVELAMSSTDDCVEDLQVLLEIWLRQSQTLMNDIRTSLENRDAAKLRQAAHTLKGSLQILCAETAAKAALGLEYAGRDQRVDDGPALLVELESELDQIRPKIEEFLKRCEL